METFCSCGVWHTFDDIDDAKKFEFGEIPEAIMCDECPICEPETFYIGKEEILLENYSEDDEKDEFYFLLKESLGDFDVPDDDFSDDKDYDDEDFDEDEGEDKPLK
jgi:hypothetical protein